MTVAIYEIPLQPGTPQKFWVTLSGVQYRMVLQWRETGAGSWFLDILDNNLNQLLAGIRLVTGADLLAQYPFLGFKGQLFVATDGEPDDPPTFDNLGVTSHLYYVVTS